MEQKDSIDITVESEINKMAEEIFAQFGLTKNEVIELFYHQVALTKQIPFMERNFNQQTLKAIEEVNHKENLSSYYSFTEIREDLGV